VLWETWKNVSQLHFITFVEASFFIKRSKKCNIRIPNQPTQTTVNTLHFIFTITISIQYHTFILKNMQSLRGQKCCIIDKLHCSYTHNVKQNEQSDKKN